MVLLTVTSTARAAIDEFVLRQRASLARDERNEGSITTTLERTTPDGPVEHSDLIVVSKYLVNENNFISKDDSGQSRGDWRLEQLLHGASVYYPPPQPKPEPTPEFKALMQRLREDEERRQYERMLSSSGSSDPFGVRSRNVDGDFNPALSHGRTVLEDKEIDEVTYSDVNRQMILIINVLVSIIACSVSIWLGARRWSVPQRLALSIAGSLVVAVAEVAIYLGYIRRIHDAKKKEHKLVEQKQITETWTTDHSRRISEESTIRHRKGKHR